MCVCVCVCEREREREGELVSSSNLAKVDLKIAGTHFQFLLGVLGLLHQLKYICRCGINQHNVYASIHVYI